MGRGDRHHGTDGIGLTNRRRRLPRKSTRAKAVKREEVKPQRTAVSQAAAETVAPPAPRRFRARARTGLAVTVLLSLHYALAARSLVQENPTVDEVVHLPAGVTYWQKGTFRLYHHNPPLVKLVAALPVVWASPVTAPAYDKQSWRSKDPSPPSFSQDFAFLNAARYFELFQLARLTMPLFSIVGGMVVFAWSRRLYGIWGGILSLSLWVFCPNVLAHARLITTDLGSTALGVAATYLFWRYLERPGWMWVAAAGVVLGLAQLTKFSMLLLYAVWPFLWLVRLEPWLTRAQSSP
jgi:dolichyl-phosphate-mannose--protein O-mannosyl transferase